MALIDEIKTSLNEAVKSRDEVTISTLRFLISKLDNARIEKGSELNDSEVITEIAKDAKRHRESIEAYDAAGRTELSGKEKAELEVLSKYLPAQLSEGEIVKIVEEAIADITASQLSDMGRVMQLVMAKTGGRADGSLVSKIVREKLSG
ncbi:GatB/YqeY domain-containing protein [Candidatus Curtissbacteria bacterium]|nr:GatB/YqeY domain-containing protein [Candidatus Curtissbacteria bacterium]